MKQTASVGLKPKTFIQKFKKSDMICVRTKSLHITLEGDQQFCYSTRGSRLQREEFKRRHFKQTVFFSPFWFLGMTWVTGFFFLSFTCLCVLCKVPPIQILFFFFFNKKMNNKIEKAFFLNYCCSFLSDICFYIHSQPVQTLGHQL